MHCRSDCRIALMSCAIYHSPPFVQREVSCRMHDGGIVTKPRNNPSGVFHASSPCTGEPKQQPAQHLHFFFKVFLKGCGETFLREKFPHYFILSLWNNSFCPQTAPRWRRGAGARSISSTSTATPMWITPPSARRSSRACSRTRASASAILAQPDFRSAEAFRAFGRPRLGFLVSAGNIDSMVAHYTAAKKRRCDDYYSPGGKPGLRPDRAAIVYSNRIREAYGDVPIIIGGLEASLRRFAHYDYWDDRVRRSLLVDSRRRYAHLRHGRERSSSRVAKLLDRGVPDVARSAMCAARSYPHQDGRKGAFPRRRQSRCRLRHVARPTSAPTPDAYAHRSTRNQDAVHGKAIRRGLRRQGAGAEPAPCRRSSVRSWIECLRAPLSCAPGTPCMQRTAASPPSRRCAFPSRTTAAASAAATSARSRSTRGAPSRSRSIESVVREAKLITEMPGFQGLHPRHRRPDRQFPLPVRAKNSSPTAFVAGRKCLAPTPCKNLVADHSEYIELLRAVEALPKREEGVHPLWHPL